MKTYNKHTASAIIGNTIFFENDLKEKYKNEWFGNYIKLHPFSIKYFKTLSSRKIDEIIQLKYNLLLCKIQKVLIFKNFVKDLENLGYEIKGDSLTHGQSMIFKDGKNAGYIINYIEIHLKN